MGASGIVNTAVLGDARQVLPSTPNGAFQLTFTSPPYYNAREYSSFRNYADYLDFLEEVFNLVHAKTAEGRFLVVNTSPVIEPRPKRQSASKRYAIPFDLHARLVRNGWEFVDDIVWIKPAASVKNRIATFLQHRKPLGYKPCAVTEYLMVYRKSTSRLIDWNIRRYDQATTAASLVSGAIDNTNVWDICPTSDRHHPAVFPIQLCERVIKYYSYEGDMVCDPFAGSGTVAVVANRMARNYFVVERQPRYFARLTAALGTSSFWGTPATATTAKAFVARSRPDLAL